MGEPSQETTEQRSNLQEANRHLRKELEKAEARLRELETEVFKLRNEIFQQPLKGVGEFDLHLVAALRSGKTWSSKDILEELAVDSNLERANRMPSIPIVPAMQSVKDRPTQ